MRDLSSSRISEIETKRRWAFIADGDGMVRLVPVITGGKTNASLDQRAFRLRNDDGSESAATWKQNENVNATIDVDENFRVRFSIDDTASGGENNVRLQLQQNRNSAGWGDVNATSSFTVSSASGNFAEDDDTTRQLSVPTGGTFISPNSGMDEDEGLAGETNDIDFVDGTHDFVEVEFCVQLVGADLNDADTIQYRVVRSGGTALENYGSTPTVTVNKAGSTNHNVTAIETMDLTESAQRIADANRDPSETLSLTDAAQRVADANRDPSESFVTSDLAQRIADANRDFEEALALTDAALRIADASRSFGEVMDLVDAADIQLAILREAAETMALTDALDRVADANRLASDSAAFAPSASRVADALRLATDQLAAADSASRVADANRSPTEQISITDPDILATERVRRQFDGTTMAFADNATATLGAASLTVVAIESLSLTDSASRIADALRETADTTAATDAAQRVADAARQFSDPLVATDSAQRIANAARQFAESFVAIDSAQRVADALRQIVESAVATDAAQRVADAFRVITETLALADVASVSLGAATITVLAIESLAITDPVSRIASALRQAAETIVVTDAAQRISDALRQPSDAMATIDSVDRVANALRQITDQISLNTPSLSATQRVRRQFSGDTMSLIDSAVASLGAAEIARLIIETMSVSDTASRIANALRVVADSIVLMDTTSLSLLGDIIISIAETLSLRTPSLGLLEFVQRPMNPEQVSVQDLAIRLVQGTGAVVKLVIESMALSDPDASRTVPISRLIAESLIASDPDLLGLRRVGKLLEDEDLAIDDLASALFTGLSVLVVEQLAVQDSASRISDVLRSVSDTLATLDVISIAVPSLVIPIAVTETLSVTDSVQRIADSIRTIQESLVASDEVGRIADAIRSVVDTTSILDNTISITGTFVFVSVIESLALTDDAQRTADSKRLVIDSVAFQPLAERVASANRVLVDNMATLDAAQRIADVLRSVSELMAIDDELISLLIDLAVLARRIIAATTSATPVVPAQTSSKSPIVVAQTTSL